MQNLKYLAMSRLHPASEHLAPSAFHQPRDSLYDFTCNFADFCSAADVAVGPADLLSILFRVVHNGGTYLSTDMCPISLPWLLAGQYIDYPRSGDEQTKAKKAAKKFDEYVIAMPWLEHLDRQYSCHDGHDALTAAHRGEGSGGGASSRESLEVDEDTMMTALADLEIKKSVEHIILRALL